MAKISKLNILKGVAELAVTAGVGVVVGNLVRATTPVEATRLSRVMVLIGGYGLTGVLGDISGKYVANQIDTYGSKFRDLLHPPVEETDEESNELDPDVLESIADAATQVAKDTRSKTAEKLHDVADKIDPETDK